MTKQKSIEIAGVTKDFGTFRALDNVSLDIGMNEFFTLLGPSGCGKTTLLRLIAGFEVPTDGDLLLYGENIVDLAPFERPINTVFQNYALFPHLTIAKNIAYGLERLKKSKAEIEEIVQRKLALVQLEHLAERLPHQLSGGQQQRVALARALAPNPKVLLLDEPLSALDQKLRKEMQIELKRLQQETGVTFIFVTHDQEEALTMSDRIAVMSNGEVQQIGSPKEIYDTPANLFVADFIGETNFLKARISSASGQDKKVILDCGAEIACADKLSPFSDNDAVTVTVRPEHVLLNAPNNGISVRGRVSNIVYFGTDTQCHIDLANGEEILARVQNSNPELTTLKQGDDVQVSISLDAVQLLRGEPT